MTAFTTTEIADPFQQIMNGIGNHGKRFDEISGELADIKSDVSEIKSDVSDIKMDVAKILNLLETRS